MIVGRYDVGIPVSVHVSTPSDFPWFASGSLTVRPNPVAWGEGSFFVDMKANLAGGYEVFDGDEVDIRAQTELSWIRDGDAYPWIFTHPQRITDFQLSGRAGLVLLF